MLQTVPPSVTCKVNPVPRNGGCKCAVGSLFPIGADFWLPSGSIITSRLHPLRKGELERPLGIEDESSDGEDADVRVVSKVHVGHIAAGWAFVFAVRGIYWALGGTAGLGTLSPGIQRAAVDRDPSLFAALWITVALELVGVVLALALVRPWDETLPARLPFAGGKKVPGWALLTAAWGAGALLAGHGGLFVGFGVLDASGSAQTPGGLWYLFFWGPWFMIGGVLFMAAGWSFMRRSPNRRTAVTASVLGAVGGLAAAGAPLITSAIA